MVALLASGFVSVGTVFADDGVEPEKERQVESLNDVDEPDRDRYGERIDERLEACFARLNEWYEVQDGNIGKANNAIGRIEEALAMAEELGIDTSAIQALMPGLYAAVDQAEAHHAQANQILREHAGFNGAGKVKDRQAALETCRSGRDALSSARDSLIRARDIVHEIIAVVRDLRSNYEPATDMIS
jgi:hypothetical protein